MLAKLEKLLAGWLLRHLPPLVRSQGQPEGWQAGRSVDEAFATKIRSPFWL